MTIGRKGLLWMLSVLFACLIVPLAANAASPVSVSHVLRQLDHVQSALKRHDASTANQHFANVKQWWTKHQAAVTANSADASIDISQSISTLSLDLLTEQQDKALKASTALAQTLRDYESGLYAPANSASRHQSLSRYIGELQRAQHTLQAKDWVGAAAQVKSLQQNWLTVEGDVVGQSQSVYTDSERNLVMIDAYLAEPALRHKALPLVQTMIAELKPLASSNYGMWDAAFIPIREGLEALLVIGALLTFGKKAKLRHARLWIWSGTALAASVCLAVGIIVTFLFSVAAFGTNNSLINGWSGILAGCMLLYVGWWLHRNADIARWNQFLAGKSRQAAGRGRVFTFALLAFIAVLREGMETVIFLIGMAGRMPTVQLITGIAVGLGVLVVIGFLMLRIGVLLPLRPFFLISSLIVFYLCFKFIGSGIHSLQLAGMLPAAIADYLPSINSLSVFPSWVSTLPQLIFLLIIISIILTSHLPITKRTLTKESHS